MLLTPLHPVERPCPSTPQLCLWQLSCVWHAAWSPALGSSLRRLGVHNSCHPTFDIESLSQRRGIEFVLWSLQDKAHPNSMKVSLMIIDAVYQASRPHPMQQGLCRSSVETQALFEVQTPDGRLDPRTPEKPPTGTILWADHLNSDSRVIKQCQTLTPLLRSSWHICFLRCKVGLLWGLNLMISVNQYKFDCINILY